MEILQDLADQLSRELKNLELEEERANSWLQSLNNRRIAHYRKSAELQRLSGMMGATGGAAMNLGRAGLAKTDGSSNPDCKSFKQ